MPFWLESTSLYTPSLKRSNGQGGGVSLSWFDSTAYDLLSAGADFNNDRYFLPPQTEKLTNGTFDTDATSWTVTNGTASVVAGRIRITNSSAFAKAIQSFPTVVGNVYCITWDAYAGTAPGPDLSVGTTSAGTEYFDSLIAGTNTRYFIATSTTAYVTLWVNSSSAGVYSEYDNVSVKEFDLTKTAGKYPKRSASFDEWFAFTAASTGARTYTDSLGVVRDTNYGRNLFAWSSDFAGHWFINHTTIGSSANGTVLSKVAPGIGGALADKFVPASGITGAYLDAPESFVDIGKTYTISFALQASGFDFVQLNADATSGRINATAVFNLAAGSVVSGSGTITLLQTGIYLCTLTGVATDTGVRPFVRPYVNGTTEATGDGTKGIILHYAQLEQGSTASAHKPTSGSAGGANLPRFTYANGKRQLRLEDQRTNMLTWSDNLNSSWTANAVTGAASPVNGVRGVPMRRFTAQATSSSYSLYGNGTATVTTGVTYTFSAVVGYVNRQWLWLRGDDSSGTPGIYWAAFDLLNGVVGNKLAGVSAHGMKSLGGGKYLVWITFAPASGVVGANMVFTLGDSATPTNAPVTWAGTEQIDIDYAQLEAGAFPSDYIPTGASAVTRAIETARFSPLMEAIMQRSAASIVVRTDLSKPSVDTIVLGNGTVQNGIYVKAGTTQVSLWNAAQELFGTLGSGSNRDPLGVAMAFDATGRCVVANGGTVGTDANQPGARTTVYLGRSGDGAVVADGYYDFVGVSPERLPDATLQTMAVAA